MELDWQTTEERRAAIGLQTSNDRSWAIQLAVGQKITACDNKLFAGGLIALKRRHTAKLDLPAELDQAVFRYQQQFRRLQDDVQIWKDRTLDERMAKTVLYDLFTKEVLPVRLMKPIHHSYFNNGYEKTAYGLLNACIEHIKKLPAGPEFDVTVELGRFWEKRF